MHVRPLIRLALAPSLALMAWTQPHAAASGAGKPAIAPYEVEEVPLSRISADLAAGRTSSVAVTKAYIERIRKYDEALNAVILVAPDALEQAAASDQRRKAGKALGALDGVPILLKDNIDALGMPTTAGSYALIDNKPVRDSEVAKRLRAAGAVILGKANTSQWAGLRTSDSFNGSTVGGSTRNPYDLARSAAGSSNGSGIAAAVSFAAATVGTDTTGSIVSPSSYNGVVGLRPTVGLISRRGIVPVSLTQDTAGPMARTVTDAAMLLTPLAGTDSGDPASALASAHVSDYAKGLNRNVLKGLKLGVLRGTRGDGGQTRPVLDAALKVLAAQGAELIEMPADLLEDLSQEQRLIMIYDIKEDMAAYLANAPAAVKVRSMADLIAFNRADPRENIHTQDFFEAAEATAGGRRNPEYIRTLEYAKRRAGAEGFDRAMSQYGVRAIVGITRGPAEVIPPDGQKGGHVAGQRRKGEVPPSISGIAALAGYPNLSVPMGQLEGLPLGLSFVGPAWSEQLLLSLGYAYEQASNKRVSPTAYKQSVVTR